MLRSQDIYVLLALKSFPESPGWTYEQLAMMLQLSTSQVFRSLERAEFSRLFDKSTRAIIRLNLLEFLASGARYSYAVHPGGITRGIPTCWNAPGLDHILSTQETDTFVWPSPEGTVRGQAIEPLHDSAPQSSITNPQLHKLLALTDILRIGTPRERKVALDHIKALL